MQVWHKHDQIIAFRKQSLIHGTILIHADQYVWTSLGNCQSEVY